jgi:hypothetical protein
MRIAASRPPSTRSTTASVSSRSSRSAGCASAAACRQRAPAGRRPARPQPPPPPPARARLRQEGLALRRGAQPPRGAGEEPQAEPPLQLAEPPARRRRGQASSRAAPERLRPPRSAPPAGGPTVEGQIFKHGFKVFRKTCRFSTTPTLLTCRRTTTPHGSEPMKAVAYHEEPADRGSAVAADLTLPDPPAPTGRDLLVEVRAGLGQSGGLTRSASAPTPAARRRCSAGTPPAWCRAAGPEASSSAPATRSSTPATSAGPGTNARLPPGG